MFYKIYVRYEHSMTIVDKYFRDKQSFLAFIGGFYLSSPWKIERIDYETFDKEKVKTVDFIINRRQHI